MTEYQAPELNYNEYAPRFSVTLGQLIDGGMVDFTDSENCMYWGDKAYDAETYERVCDLLVARYRFREIAIIPPGRWITKIMYFIRGDLCPKYNRLYALLPDFDLLTTEDKYGKRREIESEYPETLLSENADYISTGHDEEYEDVTHGDELDRFLDYAARWKEIDVMFLDELEPYFSSIITLNINAD